MDTPAAYAQFGYSLSLVERTLTAILRTHLAQRNTDAETWYALNLIALKGPRIARRALNDELSSSPRLNPELARGLLAQLETEGLIGGDQVIEFTEKGRALHRSLADHIAAARDRLLSQFDVADVETTVRTMQAIAERATSELRS